MVKTEVFLGDEAVARAALDAGVSGVYAYPGTPSTEIMESIQRWPHPHELVAKWSVNEKVAYEQALGMSFAGRRAMVVMKHVGLNVAADPFMNSAITGVNGGLVLVVADDPGMHSSQNEQDSRYYAEFAMIPVLEPRSQQQAYDLVFAAFDLSEKFQLPVMLRLVTRLAHSRANIQVRSSSLSPRPLDPAKDARQWILLPNNARRNYTHLTDIQSSLLAESEQSLTNQLHTVEGCRRAIITSGIAANYVFEAIGPKPKDWSYLAISQYPVPVAKLQKLVTQADELVVVEEGYPLIEQRLVGLLGLAGKTVKGKLSGHLPRTGELTPDLVAQVLVSGSDTATVASQRARENLAGFALPGRPPQLCSGCPHEYTFAALNEALVHVKGGRVFGDIGCYTLAALPPYQAIASCVDMGASIAMAVGAAEAGLRPAVAVIGDSTFSHSGMTALLDAVLRKSPITVIVLDNGTVAMTGGQNSAATGPSLLNLIEGLGLDAEHIHAIEPLPKAHASNVKLITQALQGETLTVVVAQRECLETLKRAKKKEKSSASE